jgi:hypothetical protein
MLISIAHDLYVHIFINVLCVNTIALHRKLKKLDPKGNNCPRDIILKESLIKAQLRKIIKVDSLCSMTA